MAEPLPSPIPLHPESAKDPVEIPEVLLISALLATGEFTPSAHKVTEAEIVAYEDIYRFCVNHQASAGVAPDIDLVCRRFPNFPYVPNVNPTWAAEEVHRASYERGVRSSVAAAMKHLNAGDLDGIPAALNPALSRITASSRTPVRSTDLANAEKSIYSYGLPTPFPTLDKVSWGIHDDELWFLAARFSQGKSYIAALWAAVIAEAGHRVGYISTEMPAWKVSRRVNTHLARHDPDLVTGLRSVEETHRRDALAVLGEQVTGSVDTFDVLSNPMRVSEVTSIATDYDVLFIDHVGHLLNAKGIRAIDDWRVMSDISISLLEAKNAAKTPVVGVVQINRAGETKGWSTPKASDLSDSDQLGRDADAVITMNRPDDGTVVIYDARKMREHPTVRWYSKFDVEANNFNEISKDEAKSQNLSDSDRWT